jgi:hypothetical protein
LTEDSGHVVHDRVIALPAVPRCSGARRDRALPPCRSCGRTTSCRRGPSSRPWPACRVVPQDEELALVHAGPLPLAYAGYGHGASMAALPEPAGRLHTWYSTPSQRFLASVSWAMASYGSGYASTALVWSPSSNYTSTTNDDPRPRRWRRWKQSQYT